MSNCKVKLKTGKIVAGRVYRYQDPEFKFVVVYATVEGSQLRVGEWSQEAAKRIMEGDKTFKA